MTGKNLTWRFLVWGLAVLIPALNPVHADSIAKLRSFYADVNTFSADFDQVVLDENLNRIEERSGQMWLARPGKFRWDYEPPLEERVVSDGEKVWVYDIELEQITVRSLDRSLGRTPALLLAGKGNLDTTYNLEDRGEHGKVFWVALVPKSNDGNFSEIQLGFEGHELRLMQLLDQLGQITRIVFKDNETNPELTPTLFDFVPPPGVDVLDDSE